PLSAMILLPVKILVAVAIEPVAGRAPRGLAGIVAEEAATPSGGSAILVRAVTLHRVVVAQRPPLGHPIPASWFTKSVSIRHGVSPVIRSDSVRRTSRSEVRRQRVQL